MKVLYISGYTEDAALQAQVLEGRAVLLLKPITPDLFLTQVRRMLDAVSAGARTV
jgi:hypothetical protein